MLICSTVDEHRMHASFNEGYDAKGDREKSAAQSEHNVENRVAAELSRENVVKPSILFLYPNVFQSETKLKWKQ